MDEDIKVLITMVTYLFVIQPVLFYLYWRMNREKPFKITYRELGEVEYQSIVICAVDEKTAANLFWDAFKYHKLSYFSIKEQRH